MNYVKWGEFNKLTSYILEDALSNFICYIDWNRNIKNEHYPGIYEYYPYPPIENQWTKWNILEWLKQAWIVLGSEGLTCYTNNIDKCEVSIIYLSLINLCCSYVSEWVDYFSENYFKYLEYLDIKQDYILKIIRKENVDINFFAQTQNNELLYFSCLSILISRFQKKAVKILSNYYGSKQKLYLTILKNFKLELDEDYIYYSLEEFFFSEYYLQRDETEYLLNSQDNDNTNQEIESASKIIANLFDGTVFGLTTYYKNMDSQETFMYEINPNCPFSYKTIKILEELKTLEEDYVTDIAKQYLQTIYLQLKIELENPLNDLYKSVLQKLPNYLTEIFDINNGQYNKNHQLGVREFKIVTRNHLSISFIIGFSGYRDWKTSIDYLGIDHFRNYGFYCDFFCDTYLMERIESNFKFIQQIYSYTFHKDINNIIDIDLFNEQVSRYLSIEELFKKSFDELVDFIVETINYFFPLVLITTSENPLPAIQKHLKIWNPKYKLEKYVNTTNIKYETLDNWILTLQRKKQIILQGSPGTGKTFIAENIAKYLIGGTDGFYDIIQFHPAYTYEDFIQGIRPQTNNGQLEYNLIPGSFLEFCRKAKACNDNCILIIDEINRANLASVFGELMYLLEYRERNIDLAVSQEKFKIPNNVYIIGTMNTADRSIALVDFALRRRFAFITVKANYDVIRKFHKDNKQIQIESLITVLEDINQEINDSNYSLGISYFLIKDLSSEIENIWRMEIEPYLEEYFYNSLEQVAQFRWNEVKDKILG